MTFNVCWRTSAIWIYNANSGCEAVISMWIRYVSCILKRLGVGYCDDIKKGSPGDAWTILYEGINIRPRYFILISQALFALDFWSVVFWEIFRCVKKRTVNVALSCKRLILVVVTPDHILPITVASILE